MVAFQHPKQLEENGEYYRYERKRHCNLVLPPPAVICFGLGRPLDYNEHNIGGNGQKTEHQEVDEDSQGNYFPAVKLNNY